MERALERVPPLDAPEPEPVESYPVLWGRQGIDEEHLGTRRALDAGPLWRLHVAGQAGAQEAGRDA